MTGHDDAGRLDCCAGRDRCRRQRERTATGGEEIFGQHQSEKPNRYTYYVHD